MATTPKKTSTRAKKDAESVVETVGEAIDSAAETVTEAVDSAAETAKKTVSKAKKSAEDALEQVEDVVKEGMTPIAAFLEYQKRALAEASKAIEALIPAAAREHGEKAVTEMIEGYRTFFNTTTDEVMKRLGLKSDDKAEDKKAD